MAKSTQNSALTSSSSSSSGEWVHVSSLGPFNIAEQPQENEIVRVTCTTENSQDSSLVKIDPPHGVSFTEFNYTKRVYFKISLRRSLAIANKGRLPSIDCGSTSSTDTVATSPSPHPPRREVQNANKERVASSTDYTISMKSQLRSTNVMTKSDSLFALLLVMSIGYYIIFGGFQLWQRKRPILREEQEWMDEGTNKIEMKKKSKTNLKKLRYHRKKNISHRTNGYSKNTKSSLCASTATISQFSSRSEARENPKEESSLLNSMKQSQHGTSSSGGHDNTHTNDIVLSERSERLVDERQQQEFRVIEEKPVLSVSGVVVVDSGEVKEMVGSSNHNYHDQMIISENGWDEEDCIDGNNGGCRQTAGENLCERKSACMPASTDNDTLMSKRFKNINNNNNGMVDGHSISKDENVISPRRRRNGDERGDSTVEDITNDSTTTSHATHNPEYLSPLSKIHTTTQNQKDIYESVTLLVEGMSCEGCARTVRSVLENIAGVDTVVVDQRKGKAVLKSFFSSSHTIARLDLSAIVEALNGVGMQAYLPVPLLPSASTLDNIVVESDVNVNYHHHQLLNKESSITSSSLSSLASQTLEDDALTLSLKKKETTLSLMDELRIGTRPVRRYRCACNCDECICSSRPIHADDDGRDISLRDFCTRIEDSLHIDTTTSGSNNSPGKGVIGSSSALSLLKYRDQSLEELFLDNGGSNELRDGLALLPMPCGCSSADVDNKKNNGKKEKRSTFNKGW